MSILGSAWDHYRAYAEGVRREYCPAVTTAQRFAVGRVAFLRDVLASASIFHTRRGRAPLGGGGARQHLARDRRAARYPGPDLSAC
jgi:predicted metal-dependent HD superfamily phosphohydrolase